MGKEFSEEEPATVNKSNNFNGGKEKYHLWRNPHQTYKEVCITKNEVMDNKRSKRIELKILKIWIAPKRLITKG